MPVTAYCFTGTTDQPPAGQQRQSPGAQHGLRNFPELGASKEGVPFITVSGGVALGNNFEGQLPQTGNTYQFADNFSKIVGKHSIKFGGDIRYQSSTRLLVLQCQRLDQLWSGRIE